MESTPPRRRRRSRSRSAQSVRSDGLELQAWTPLAVASSAAEEQSASSSAAPERRASTFSGAVERSATTSSVAVEQSATTSSVAVEQSATTSSAAVKQSGAVEQSATSSAAVVLEQSAAPYAALESPAVLAALAHRHGAQGLPITVGLVPLRLRQLPAVILPCTFPSVVAEEKFYRAIITAAGLTSSAKTMHGLQARAFEAGCNLARQEADVLRACNVHQKADVWLKAVARAAVARRNVSNFGRAFRLSDVTRSQQTTAPRQTELHFQASPQAVVAAVERDLVNAAGTMPEQSFCDMLLDALQYLSGQELVWLSRERVERQVTADVCDVFDEVLGALLSLGLVKVSGDGQIRLEPTALR